MREGCSGGILLLLLILMLFSFCLSDRVSMEGKDWPV